MKHFAAGFALPFGDPLDRSRVRRSRPPSKL
ncbi:hypothetical protein NX02_29220 [Sphingomonas sanxanigenens DSM 19645 = NX02]|uniref:Uncharacterized protein n=1 Tax=Sphingomonas sanxanigenens DSM 19645 = NX02 TaxID=1123269 RepID=W0ALE6_9SPHN|nr:hypothetical protein NX02_29220 [Sphingomonas sanxanigenens DSM 19645 = NX02]